MQLLGCIPTKWLSQRQYYVDLFLSFGLCSSPAIFNQYADTLEFAMWANGISDLLHYLDDYFTAGPAGSGKCQHNISTMAQVCRELEFTMNPTKVTDPSPITCFLGINIDLCKGVVCIDPECLEEIMHELVSFKQAKLVTKHEIFSLISKLHFIAGYAPQVKHSCTGWLRCPRRYITCITESSWIQSSALILNGGSPTCQPGMGSATCIMLTGPASQMWSCLQMPETKALVVTFRVNGVKVSFQSKHSMTSRWASTGVNFMQLPRLCPCGDLNLKANACSFIVIKHRSYILWLRPLPIARPWWPWSIHSLSSLCNITSMHTSSTLQGSTTTQQTPYPALRWTGFNRSAHIQRQNTFPRLTFGSSQLATHGPSLSRAHLTGQPGLHVILTGLHYKVV